MTKRIGIAFSIAVGAAALWLYARPLQPPVLFYDSYQYMDAARNLESGECLCTHLANFDEQVAYGRMPVPFTHFPPAYPLMISWIARAGVPLEWAAVAISIAGFFLVIWLMWDIWSAF